jgi:pimeloyl-ACP methyl ester carboxylesterase
MAHRAWILRVVTNLKPFGKTPRQRLLNRLALYGGAIFIGMPLAFSYVMTRSYRSSSPAAVPREYQELWLSSEGLRLRAWLGVESAERPSVVVVHGLGDSLESYLEHARPLRERGHSVLLVDLRGHGGSEGSYTTLGGRERADVRAAMEELRRRGLAGHGIVLMGHSMGAVAALLAAAEATDLRGVIVEAPYDTYRNSVVHHARHFYGLPSWVPMIPIAIAAAEWRAGFDADDVDAVAAAHRIRAPLFAIVDGLDPRMPEAVVRRIYDAHPGPKRLWVAPGVDHVGAIMLSDHWPRVRAFLEESGL